MTEETIDPRAELAALRRAGSEAFVTTAWAANALQTGRSANSAPYLHLVPADAASDGILGSTRDQPLGTRDPRERAACPTSTGRRWSLAPAMIR